MSANPPPRSNVPGRPVEQEIHEGKTSDAVMVGGVVCTVRLIPLAPGSKGLVEFSISTMERIQANQAFWTPWLAGEVDEITTASPEGPIYALRARCTAGRMLMEVCRQPNRGGT